MLYSKFNALMAGLPSRPRSNASRSAIEHDSRVRAVIDAVQQLSSFKFVPTEYVRIDRTRVRANDARAIAHDRSVRAVLDAADRLSLFVPTHIAQLLCDYARPGKAQHRLSYCVALKIDGSLVSWGLDVDGQVRDIPTGAGFVAVAVGLALKSDGSLVSWGYDGHGAVSNTPTGAGFL